MFDKNRDGRLSPSERAAMLEFVKEGGERTLYKRDDQLFDHQLSSWILQRDKRAKAADPHWEKNTKTKAHLELTRRDARARDNQTLFDRFRKQVEQNEAMLRYRVQSEDPKSPQPILSEVLLKRKYANRPGVGLAPEPFDEKTIRKDPSTERYVKSPHAKTQAELAALRRLSNKTDMIAHAKKGHKDIYARLKEKENAFLQEVFSGAEGKSLKQMKQARKEDKKRLNTLFFDDRFVKGIHKPELPSFQGHADKLLGKPSDAEQSFRKLWQDRQFWAKNDALFLNEVESNDKQGPSDAFKVEHVPIKRKLEVVKEFPQNKTIAFPRKPADWGAKLSTISWTNQEYYLRAKKHGTRHFEEYPEAVEFSTDLNPLYSSFAKDACFSPKPLKALRSSIQKAPSEFKADDPQGLEDLHPRDLNLLTRYSSFVRLEPPSLQENPVSERASQK